MAYSWLIQGGLNGAPAQDVHLDGGHRIAQTIMLDDLNRERPLMSDLYLPATRI